MVGLGCLAGRKVAGLSLGYPPWGLFRSMLAMVRQAMVSANRLFDITILWGIPSRIPAQSCLFRNAISTRAHEFQK
jgi:hypothetical protein